ncbi:conserved hypothetical protein [Flavobacteriaceae bacterium 3519-10]|nr:conserved hypothetical protein [Flavobacteriaceae bacterium 3519-10]
MCAFASEHVNDGPTPTANENWLHRLSSEHYMLVKNIIYKINHWETWDWRLKYVPILPVWIWNCIRAKSWWFFSPSNPKLTFGGFEGVSKMSIYQHLPPGTYPPSTGIKANLTFPEMQKLVEDRYAYPFVVKPDVGRMGYMFRIVRNASELKAYHEIMPVDYLVQELVLHPLEVSVFYYRFPDQKSGTITGFVRKEFLEITGDGHSTVDELMAASPHTCFRLEELRAKHLDKLHLVLQKDEIFCLSYALNLSRGCSLISLEDEIDENLVKVFDELSSYSDTLFYGRYDIKCASIADLKQGKNFSIIEYNGCGAEPHHVYGNGNTLFKACRILAQHWLILAEISRYNYSKGVRYISFRQGWETMRSCRKYFAKLRKLDAAFPEF